MSSPAPRLNPAQKAAVEHGEGPLLVLAGPGSGKTRVVTHRIARLLASGVPAASILAVTFTNKAAREMRERVRSLARGKAASALTLSTFHAACCRILRGEIEALGYRRNFSIYDQANQESLLRTVLRDLGGAGASRSPSQVLERAAAPQPAAAEPEEAQKLAFARMAHERYREELKARNAVDFDDLIGLVRRLFREHPERLARWQERFRWILVDEYQDTNREQDDVLTLLAGTRRNLTVVGDDDQSIYRWRGAEVEHILRFPERWPGARVIRLEENYRSTGRIVAAANAVIALNTARHGKAVRSRREEGLPVRVVELRDEEEEARFLAGEIAAELAKPGRSAGAAGREHAVLVRTNEQTRPIEQALRERKIPYRILGGKSFFDRKEVMDLLAYLRLAANRADEEALLRVINVPARGIGARSCEAVARRAAEQGSSIWQAVCSAAALPGADFTPAQAAALTGFVAVVEQLERSARARDRQALSELIARTGYRDEIDRNYQSAEVRAARQALAQGLERGWEVWLGENPQAGFEDFVDTLALRGRDDAEEDQGGVTLATAHAAKGLEFRCVYVAGAEEGLFPHGKSALEACGLEEERRLFYVAMTRAMDRLVFTRAAQRVVRGKGIKTAPSRFLEALPAEVRHEQAEERAAALAAPALERMRAQLAARAPR